MARKKRATNRIHAAGAIALVAGLVLALSFLPEATGLPRVLGRMQRVALGDAAWVIPLAGILGGIALLRASDWSRFGRRTTGAALIVLASLAAYHARVPKGAEWSIGISGRGAGVVGGALWWALRGVLGDAGSWLALVLGAIGGMLLWSNISLANAIKGLLSALQWTGRGLANVIRTTWQAAAAGATAVLGLIASLLGAVVDAVWGVGRMIAERLSAMAKPAQGPTTSSPLPSGPATSNAAEIHVPPAAIFPPLNGETRIRVGARPREDQESDAASRRAGAAFKQETLALEVPSGGYQLPPLTLLTDLPSARGKGKIDPADLAEQLEQTLSSFGVEAKVSRWEQGPVVTRFEVQPAPGVRVQKISSLTNDIALALAAPSVRIEAPIPGKSAVGIEVPNQKTALVHIKEILGSDEYQRATGPLIVAVGKDIAGHPILADLTEMPHLLIAGATGSGKSVMLNAIIAGFLFRCTPVDVRLLMIDPKRVEFAHYNNIPHLLAPVVTNPRAAAGALREMLREMEERFERFAATGTRNIQAYNQLSDVDRLPALVIVIDELADLMMVAPGDFEDVICRLAQMTRATGIHMVLATQRPSVDVITGLIKANIPSRIAFAVSSQVDSRTILDTPGAEKLLGKGDMLYLPMGAARPVRAQGAFIADSEIQALVAWWKAQGRPVYDQDVLQAESGTAEAGSDEDELLAEAARLIVRAGYGSVSLLQRKMKIGYVRAARIVDQLEEKGIVGPTQGSNPREVLVGLEELERLIKPGSPSNP
jgi:S-DNA-T family DNA segregation ATPase FtsK/SpoIIIE